ncbi:MAG: hypothetical protein AB9842_13725 [Bacteroidales bacterium]
MKQVLLPLIFVMACYASPAMAQEAESEKYTLDVNADLVSSYLWRGVVSDMKPNIQPTVAFSTGNFEAGIWGSSNFDNTYREVDYWLSYSYKNFTLTFNDYCWSPYLEKGKYFNWNQASTNHYLELQLDWEGPEKFPIKCTAATFVYGLDKKFEDNDTMKGGDLKNNYSTYLELGYPFIINHTELSVFAGGTPGEGFYADKAAVINVGVSAKKQLPITEKYSLPLTGTLIVNPKEDQVYFVLGITL